MALDNAALLEVLEAMQAAGVEDRVRTAAQTIYQALIDAELTAVIGAGPWERSPERIAQRNGSRSRTLTTTQRSNLDTLTGQMNNLLATGAGPCAPVTAGAGVAAAAPR